MIGEADDFVDLEKAFWPGWGVRSIGVVILLGMGSGWVVLVCVEFFGYYGVLQMIEY